MQKRRNEYKELVPIFRAGSQEKNSSPVAGVFLGQLKAEGLQLGKTIVKVWFGLV